MKVVSLGCGLGNMFGDFVRRGHTYFGDDTRFVRPEECLGIDTEARFERDLVTRGYQFQALDIIQPEALELLPEADWYILWEFLDRLPNTAWSTAVLKVVLHRCRRGAWLRLNSFEQDTRVGEGVLKQLGMRFAWTRHPKHPAHYTTAQLVQDVNEYKKEAKRGSVAVKLHPGRRVHGTDDPCVLPLKAPAGFDAFDFKVMGAKPTHTLNPPLVAQWEAIATL